MSTIDLVVFDLAGTTVNDDGAVLDAFRGALNRFSVPYEEHELAMARGANKLQVFRHFASRAFGPGDDAVRVTREAYGAFNEELLFAFRNGPLEPFDGVVETFVALKERDLKLASNTGFSRDLADAILTRLGWHGYFDAAITSEDVPVGRPAPYMIYLAMERAGVQNARRVLAIGDTPLDLQAGTNAGCGGVVGVLTGTHGVATLGATRHTHLLPSVAALPALLDAEFA